MMSEYGEYCARYKEDETAEELIRLFWKMSEFSEKDLIRRLWRFSGLDEDFEEDEIGEDTDFDTDFLRRENLFLSGLELLGMSTQNTTQFDGVLQKDLPEMIADIISQLKPVTPSKSPLSLTEVKAALDEIGTGYFDCMRAEAVLLLIRSKDFLHQWCRDFSLIAGRHPCWLLPVRNVLSLTFRGEALIVDGHVTHRKFADCEKKFTALVGDKTDSVWRLKRSRIAKALEGM